MERGHVHVMALTILIVIAIVGLAHYTIRTVAAQHPDSPAARGALWLWG
jgi:Na+/pantothenate symporter